MSVCDLLVDLVVLHSTDPSTNASTGEYLWDHRNASMRQWLISEHLLGPTGLGNPNISGFL